MSSTSAITEQNDQRWQAETIRANRDHLIARALTSPPGMVSEDAERLRELVPVLAAPQQPTGAELAASWKQALEDRENLSRAYARLFLGPFEVLASPYASSYLEASGRLMGEVSRAVAGWYVDAGLEAAPGPQEAPDHMALEWEFLYYLGYQAVSTREQRWLDLRMRFQETHLNLWMPQWARAVLVADLHPFYSALAQFVMKSLEP